MLLRFFTFEIFARELKFCIGFAVADVPGNNSDESQTTLKTYSWGGNFEAFWISKFLLNSNVSGKPYSYREGEGVPGVGGYNASSNFF